MGEFTNTQAVIGLLLAVVGLAVMLDRRGVLNRQEFAELLEGLGPKMQGLEVPNAPDPSAFLNVLADAIRHEKFDKLPPGWKAVMF